MKKSHLFGAFVSLVACFYGTATNASVVYSYQGNNFDTVNDSTSVTGISLTTSQSVFVSFEAASLLVNLSNTPITPVTFNISDGVTSFTEASTLDTLTFNLTTDSFGAVTAWFINAIEEDGFSPGQTEGQQWNEILTNGNADIAKVHQCNNLQPDTSCGNVGFDSAFTLGNPGQWTSPVPVPAAIWLLSSGLLGLVGIARRKKTT